MANYLLVYRGGPGMPATPQEGQKIMAAWERWGKKLGDALVDFGNPLGQRSLIKPDGSVSPSKGGATALSGYSILKANSQAAAVKLAKGCPILKDGGAVEVCEVVPAM